MFCNWLRTEKQRERVEWGGGVEVAGFPGRTLFPFLACVIAAAEWRGLQGEHRGSSFQAILYASPHQDAFSDRQIYFAGWHLLVTLQKPPTVFYSFYLCALMTSASFLIDVNHVSVSVKTVFDSQNQLWTRLILMFSDYKFTAQSDHSKPPEKPFLLLSECIPFLWISVVL